jgi:hypothetical protein
VLTIYIERETALNLISDIFFKTDPDGEEQCGVIKCSKAIRNAPAADVVEVVRCKECVKRNTADCSMYYECDCGQQHTWETDNDFCSYGERRCEE